MGRSKRGRKVKKTASDEEDINENEGPDPESDDFFHDAVDKFNLNREKILLDADADESDTEDSIEDEEVIGLDLPDSEDEDEDEDDDENDDDDDDDDDSDQETKLPSDKSWGKKKSAYYSADTNEQQVGHAGSDDEAWEMEKEEEVEALALQKRLTAGLDEEDFDTADFEIPHVDDTEETSVEDEEVNKTIVMDLTKLSKEQKLELLFRNSPELFELLDEFKEKLEELSSKLSPLMQLSKTGKLPIEGSKYVELKYRLVLNYCINIGFYLLLKSKQTPVKDHPVIERIVQYRNIIKELEPLDKKLENDIQFLVENKQALLAASENTEFDSTTKARKTTKSKKVDNKKQVKKPKAKLSSLLEDSDEDTTGEHKMEPKPKRMKKSKDSIDPLEYYEKVRLEKKKAKEMKNLAARLAHEPDLNLDDLDVNEEGKRAITYQISKNKGLTARKKKEDRNPRVKHRKKYSKAIIKRKSQVRPVTNEITRYDGEKSGIRAFLTRSTKIK